MKIRIAVAVDNESRWEAYGQGYAWESYPPTDDEMRQHVEGILSDCCPEYMHTVFVEVDVPLPPEPVVVQGTVVP